MSRHEQRCYDRAFLFSSLLQLKLHMWNLRFSYYIYYSYSVVMSEILGARVNVVLTVCFALTCVIDFSNLTS